MPTEPQQSHGGADAQRVWAVTVTTNMMPGLEQPGDDDCEVVENADGTTSYTVRRPLGSEEK
jgi:hypothetical protein